MEEDNLVRYFFIGILLVLLYFTFLMVQPFLKYILMGLILTYFMFPIYKWIRNRTPNAGIASGIMIVLILLVLIIPALLVTRSLVNQATSAITTLQQMNVMESGGYVLSSIGIERAEVSGLVEQLGSNLGGFVVEGASSFLSSLPHTLVGLFILFFILYYGFKDGENVYNVVEKYVPLKPKHKEKLIEDFKSVSNAVLYGQILTAVIQGTVGALGFVIFGIPNAVFWGFIMIVLSFLPVVGTPIVWIPAGLLELAANDYTSGIGILIYGTILVMNIDNVVRPKLISDRAKIHPIIVLIGVLGGLVIFGFSGIVLGPLIMALLITMMKFYSEEKSFTV